MMFQAHLETNALEKEGRSFSPQPPITLGRAMDFHEVHENTCCLSMPAHKKNLAEDSYSMKNVGRDRGQ